MPVSLNALACVGDYLRIWQLKENGTHLIKLLNNVRASSALFLESKKHTHIPSQYAEGCCSYRSTV